MKEFQHVRDDGDERLVVRAETTKNQVEGINIMEGRRLQAG